MGARPKWKVTGAKLGCEDASEVAPYPSESGDRERGGRAVCQRWGGGGTPGEGA